MSDGFAVGRNQPYCGPFAKIMRQPTDGALFFFTWSPGALHVFRSDGGEHWWELTNKACSDHDATCVTWDKARGQFLNLQTTLEPFAKRYPDNLGNHRRVLSFRRSTDGLNWGIIGAPLLGPLVRGGILRFYEREAKIYGVSAQTSQP